MKIIKIGYQHSFQVTQFLYDKIYFEAELSKGDIEDEAVVQLIEKCKEVAKRVQDGVNGGYLLVPRSTVNVESEERIHIDYIPKQPQEKRIGVLTDDILSCTDIKVLETYRFIKDTNPDLKEAYDKRYSELKK